MKNTYVSKFITPFRIKNLFKADRSITIMRTSDIEELVAAIRSIPGDPEELLDTDGVRLLLGGGRGKMVSKSTITNWRKEGILVPIKIGKGRQSAVRFRRQDVLEAIRKIGKEQSKLYRN